MDKHFEHFRKNTVGFNQELLTPFGQKPLIYADWIASGRLYKPIEEALCHRFGPFIGNTHTESSTTGTLMTNAYHEAQNIIKKHVNANKEDVIMFAGSGMTAAINKMQRLLGIKCHNTMGEKNNCIPEEERPVVFITHMEHHSNQTSWYETLADVVVVEPDENLLVSIENLRKAVQKYENRKLKIGSFTAASNVTGIETPVHELAKVMHEYNGLCFIDYAASAPYVNIDMHPLNEMEKLDAVFFSPHKFLGGPGTSGVMIFDSKIYKNPVPDNPGGGTVDWTNPWGEYKYIDDIEAREDGGTPGFLQAIRTALAIRVKEQMNTAFIREREDVLLEKAFNRLENIPGVNILAPNQKKRIGVISLYIDDLHYNLAVKLLNDLFGIQTRGGCACAGTYGHFLLGVSHEHSKKITELINHGDLSQKPGWIRVSLHPTMSDQEFEALMDGLDYVANNFRQFSDDYLYNKHTNEFRHCSEAIDKAPYVTPWFEMNGN